MPSMDFDAALAAETREPITFTLKGETFRCVDVDDLPWTAGMRMAAAPETGPEAEHALREWFLTVIVPEDHDAWLQTYQRIGVKAFGKLVEWLIGVYSGRPPEQPSSSPSGPGTTGRSSKVVNLWAPPPATEASEG